MTGKDKITNLQRGICYKIYIVAESKLSGSNPNHLYDRWKWLVPGDQNDLGVTIYLFLWFIQVSHRESMPNTENYNSLLLF